MTKLLLTSSRKMFRNVVALVTGGASGLGHATVKRLTKLGSKVVFCDLSTSKGHEIAKESGENVTYVPANVCKEEDVQNVLNEIERLHGRLNVVVNCAGLADAHPTYNFNKSRARELSEFHHILKTNVLGQLNVSRLAVKLLAQNEPDKNNWRGVIVNTAGVEGISGTKGQATSAAASGAIIAMTQPLALDLNELGIRVVAIVPGVIRTPICSFIPPDVQKIMSIDCMIAPNRFGEADEYAHIVQSCVFNSSLNATTIELAAGFTIPC